jgi:hypothetical protein
LFVGSKGRRKGICGTQQMSDLYVPMFMLKLLSFSFLLVVGLWAGFGLIAYTIACLFFISTATLLLMRPYTSIFSNITIIICEFTSLYALSLAMVIGKIEMTEEAEIFLLLILEGLIIIALALTAIRIVIYYRYLWRVSFDESIVEKYSEELEPNIEMQ